MNAKNQPNPAAVPAGARPCERGFTLVEIMVVIVILGLLATLVTQNILGASDEARIGKAQSDIKTIAGAVRLHYSKTGRLPESIEALAEPDENDYKYLETLSDDPWGNPYVLIEGDRARDFEVISWGPDRTEGTEDDISSKSKKED